MIRIITWNMGGAKFLELREAKRTEFVGDLNRALEDLTARHSPDFLLLQEVVKYGVADAPDDPIKAPDGYYYDSSIAIDTVRQSHPRKWSKYYERGGWSPGTYLAQGYGIMWRQDIAHAPIWDFLPSKGPALEKEVVRLDTGLFTGTRDSEPRLAVVAHFVLDRYSEPVDVFVVDLHLTTLQGEREGSPKLDTEASDIRLQQLNIVLNGIVSRYNEWFNENKLSDRAPAIWVLTGDLNCIPGSREIVTLKDRNFIDLNPNKGAGTKGSGFPVKRGTITLDYIFAGPAYYALDPYLLGSEIKRNPTPLDDVQVSDHFPVRADLPVLPVKR